MMSRKYGSFLTDSIYIPAPLNNKELYSETIDSIVSLLEQHYLLRMALYYNSCHRIAQRAMSTIVMRNLCWWWMTPNRTRSVWNWKNKVESLSKPLNNLYRLPSEKSHYQVQSNLDFQVRYVSYSQSYHR